MFSNNSNFSEFNVVIGTEGALDTSGKEPDDRFDTALRVLQVRNGWTFPCEGSPYLMQYFF